MLHTRRRPARSPFARLARPTVSSPRCAAGERDAGSSLASRTLEETTEPRPHSVPGCSLSLFRGVVLRTGPTPDPLRPALPCCASVVSRRPAPPPRNSPQLLVTVSAERDAAQTQRDDALREAADASQAAARRARAEQHAEQRQASARSHSERHRDSIITALGARALRSARATVALSAMTASRLGARALRSARATVTRSAIVTASSRILGAREMRSARATVTLSAMTASRLGAREMRSARATVAHLAVSRDPFLTRHNTHSLPPYATQHTPSLPRATYSLSPLRDATHSPSLPYATHITLPLARRALAPRHLPISLLSLRAPNPRPRRAAARRRRRCAR